MLALLRSTWALMLGVVLLMAGNGLLASLMGLRGSLEGFSSTVVGGLMSGYFIGFLASSRLTPIIVRNVGHIRVFAALAGLVTAAAILASLFVLPAVWLVSRIMTGFAFAGLYVVAESWVNDRSGNETRGRLFSVYMLMQYAGLIAGQAMLNLAPATGFELFNLVALLFSVAVIPVLLTAKHAPAIAAPQHVSLREIYRISPLGTVGVLGLGMAQSAFFSLGAVFAHRIGLTTEEMSIFLSAGILGGAVLQWHVGDFSDKFGRRRLLTAAALASAALAAVAILASSAPLVMLVVTVFLFSSTSMPIYSLCIAHTNDSLSPQQMVAASGTLMLVYGTGAIGGPFADGALMSWLGPGAFFGYLAGAYLLVGLFGIYRMIRRPEQTAKLAAPLPEAGPGLSAINAASESAPARSPR